MDFVNFHHTSFGLITIGSKIAWVEKLLTFPGDLYVLFAISTFIYFYGGYPFLKGFYDEVKSKKPGMMTLIAVAISTAYVYSSVVVFGLEGGIFFWNLLL
nr:hypothetical protein [Marinitoga lauensis]